MGSRLIPKAPEKVQFIDLRKSAGILDDYAVRKNVATKEGTIEKVPTADNHIVNKLYVTNSLIPYAKLDTTNQPFTGTIQATNLILSSGTIKPLVDSTTALNFSNAAGTAFTSLDTTNSRITLYSSSLVGAMDLVAGGMSLKVGADANSNTRTNSTNKNARIACSHYNNSEEPLGMYFGGSTSTAGVVSIGGGDGLLNAATEVNIYAASNNTTTTGTKIANFSYQGMRFGTAAGNAPFIFPFDGTTYSTPVASGRGLSFYTYATLASQTGYAFSGDPVSHTTATTNNSNLIVRSFTPTSGSGVFNLLQLAPTINQTGGASGISRGLYINPTLTSAADFRAIETTTGNITLCTSSGNVGIGTTTPLAKTSIMANSASFTPVTIGSNATFVMNIADNLDNISGVQMGNVNSGTAADFRFLIKDTTDHYIAFMQPSVNYSGTLFGVNRKEADFIISAGGTTRHLCLGNSSDKDLFFATNSLERMRIKNNGTLIITDAGNISLGTTTGTKIGTGVTEKIGFWNATPVIQQTTNAYTSDGEGVAYTGIDNAQAGTPYAQLTDLNQLRVAYETLRASYDDLLTKLKNTGIVA